MIEDCVLCGKARPSAADLALCRAYRFHALDLTKDAPPKLQDRLWSQEIAEAAIVVLEQYGASAMRGVVVDYLRLILAGLRTEADLMGVLVKEGKLTANEAKGLSSEIAALYFE